MAVLEDKKQSKNTDNPLQNKQIQKHFRAYSEMLYYFIYQV